MKVDPAFQQPPGMSTHQSQPYPIVHSQEIKNEPWTSYAAPGSSYGPQGVHDPSWHNGQAIRRGNPTDDVQEGSREAWQAAKNVIPERRALSRATSMAPSSQQNAARRLASFTPSIQRQTPQQAHSYEGSYDYLRPNAGQRLQSFTPSIQGQTPSPAQAYEGPRETRRPSAAQRLQSYTPSVQGQTPSQQTHPDERSRESLRANAAQRHQSYTPSIQEQTPSAQRLESSTPGNRRHRLSSADSDEISRNKRRRESILRKKVQNTFLNLYHQVDEAESRAEKAEARISRAQSLALDAEARAQEAQVQALDAEARAREAQAQIHAQATQPPTLPVLEPRIRILVPVCVSGASLVPPPTQAFEIAFQVQEPALVEGREARQ
ncbi:hypothetical protein TGAMA5MH_06427 [Trichoderma gamsii]|uniref:Uncharacterized protein n=1 Tax=Trichoderma gamsii TaxID=398673 RepID=A0A2K0T801_9HYPO|nr:hypothetical protein TGAMA5MH_06427 [Trichoderma gamsii]